MKKEIINSMLTAQEEVALLPRMRKVINLASRSRAKRVLDIGCGDGSYSILLKEVLGADEVYGIELVPEAAAQAEKKGIKVAVLDINCADFPFESDYFDAIFATEIIEHSFNPDHLLEEFHRVLKPHGFCVISTPNLASWHSRLLLLMGYQPYCLPVRSKYATAAGSFLRHKRADHRYLTSSARGGLGHVQFFTLKALRKLLESHGFKVKNVIDSHDVAQFHIPLLLSCLVALAEGITSKLFPSLASCIIVKASKETLG